MQGNVAYGDTSNFCAAGLRDLFEREVSSERLARDRERHVVGLHAEEWSGRQRERNDARADGELPVHCDAGGVHSNRKRATELHAGHIHGDSCVAELRGHAGGREKHGALCTAHGDEIRGAIAEAQADIFRRDADDLFAADHLFIKCEVARERLAKHRELDLRGLEGRDEGGCVELHEDVALRVRDGEQFVHDLTGIIHADENVAVDGDTVQSDDLHAAHRCERVGAIRELDESDGRVGNEQSGRERVDFAIREFRRPLTEEDVQSLTREDGFAADICEADVALDGDEVADIQRKVAAKELEEALRAGLHFGVAEADVDRASADGDGFVNRRRGGIDPHAEAATCADRSRGDGSLTGENTRDAAGLQNERAFAVLDSLPVNRDGDIRHRDACDAANARAALIKEEVADEIEAARTADIERRAEHRHAEERSGRHVELHGLATYCEGLVHRTRAGVQLHAHRVESERESGCGKSREACAHREVGRDSIAVDEQQTLAVCDADKWGAVRSEVQFHIAESDANNFLAETVRNLLEGEVALQLHAGEAEFHVVSGDAQIAVRSVCRVGFDSERAGERDARNRCCDCDVREVCHHTGRLDGE